MFFSVVRWGLGIAEYPSLARWIFALRMNSGITPRGMVFTKAASPSIFPDDALHRVREEGCRSVCGIPEMVEGERVEPSRK
jgi:hypothetical protein